MRTPSGLRIDNPAWPLLQAGIAYWGVTSGAGNALGTTLVCADLDNHPTYVNGVSRIKVLTGGAWGQDRLMMIHAAGGIITVDDAFTDATGAAQQIAPGTLFVILSASGGGGGGGAGMPPTTALWMFGIVSPAQVASTTVIDIPHLAGFQDNTFNDEFYMQILHAGGAAPEGDKRIITLYGGGIGRFTTDAFSANVEAGDIVAIFHTSIEAIDIIARGTLDTSSATVPADSTRAEGNNHFRGHLFIPTEGTYAGRATRIVEYTGVGGIFILDPNNPLPGVSGEVDYIIVKSQTEFVPAADAAINRTPSDVIGNKTDTAIAAADNVSSIIRYLKGLIAAVGGASLAGKPNVQEVIIYPVAEDAGVIELADDGASPAYYPAAPHSTAANAEGAPGIAWSEDLDFEQEGTIDIISIYAEFEWQTRFLVGAGAGTQSSSKIQISRDGGTNWVDLTDNFNNGAAVMTNRIRAGVGRWITTIVAGANQLQLRLVHWTDDGGGVSTSEAQIRSNSYIRLTYRKS